MILKSISHHSKGASTLLIKYVFDNRKSLTNEQGEQVINKQHLRGYDTKRWIEQYKELEAIRKSKHSKAITMYHEVLSFSPESSEHLKDTRIIKDLVKKYLSLRNNNQLVAVGVHFENNIHAHILLSGISKNGYSARISKSKYASIKKELQAYQQSKYPFLSDSIVRHGLKKKD